MTEMTEREALWYTRAIEDAEARFRPLTEALTRELGLDVEPAVDQTGGMVMCLGIHWPDDKGWVWVSDYWWTELIVGLYDNDDDQGICPEPPPTLLAKLVPEDEDKPLDSELAELADAIAKWATPFITVHGASHGWERRF